MFSANTSNCNGREQTMCVAAPSTAKNRLRLTCRQARTCGTASAVVVEAMQLSLSWSFRTSNFRLLSRKSPKVTVFMWSMWQRSAARSKLPMQSIVKVCSSPLNRGSNTSFPLSKRTLKVRNTLYIAGARTSATKSASASLPIRRRRSSIGVRGRPSTLTLCSNSA